MPAMSLTDPMPAPRVLDGELWLAAQRDAVRAAVSPAFDACRASYATVIACGLAPRSLLAWRDVEAALDAAERWALGPFARGVWMS